MSSKGCAHDVTEPCTLHPVDCPNCVKGEHCQQRPIMQAHPDKIRSCPRFVRRR